MKKLWQNDTLEELKNILLKDDWVKSIILIGSLANESIKIDFWSDIDIKIITSEAIASNYYEDTSWLNTLWNIFTIDKNHVGIYYTIRVCFDDFRCIDIVFITINENTNNIQIPKIYKILHNTIPNIENIIEKTSDNSYTWINIEWLKSFEKWFIHKSRVAITKVMRNDLIMAQHLTIDLARDCLVLQMNLRDIKFNTNIHRTWWYGNEIINEISLNAKNWKDILNHIKMYSDVFYKLLLELWIKNTNKKILKRYINKALIELK